MGNANHLATLKRGVEEWNAWRVEHLRHWPRADRRQVALSGPDLSGADLSEADLNGANLSWVNLIRADLSGTNLRRADLRGADLSAANLSRANLSKAILRAANLASSDLSEANLSRANLRAANLCRANLRGANLRGANLREANLTATSQLDGIGRQEPDFTGANLTALVYDAESSATRSFLELAGAKGLESYDTTFPGLTDYITAAFDYVHAEAGAHVRKRYPASSIASVSASGRCDCSAPVRTYHLTNSSR